MLDYSNFTQSVNNILISVIILLVTFLLSAYHQEPAQKNADKEVIVQTHNQAWPRTISTAKGELVIL